MSRLPPEVLQHVFRDARLPYLPGTKMLAKLCQCSRQFRAIAEPILYNDISIVSWSLVETLCNRPDLASHIRCLDVCILDETEDLIKYPEDGIWPIVSKVKAYVRDNYSMSSAYNDFLEDVLKGWMGPPQFWDNIPVLLLLTLAKNIDTFKLSVQCMIPTQIYRLFIFCGDHFARIMTLLDNDEHQDKPSLPLSSLRTISASLAGEIRAPDNLLELQFAPIFYFPLLAKFDGCGITPYLPNDNLNMGDNVIEDLTSSYELQFSTQNVLEQNGSHENRDNEEATAIEQDLLHQTAQDYAIAARAKMYPSFQKPAWGCRSHMEALELNMTEVETRGGFEDVLRIFPNLEDLSIFYLDHHDIDFMDFTSWGMVLRRYGRNLKWFSVDLDYNEDLLYEYEHQSRGTLGALGEELAGLQGMRVPLSLLVGNGVEGGVDVDGVARLPVDLCALLPPRLKYLWVEYCERSRLVMHNKVLAKLLEDAPNMLPTLEWIVARVNAHMDVAGDIVNWEIKKNDDRYVVYRKRGGEMENIGVWKPPGWREMQGQYVKTGGNGLTSLPGR